MRTPTISTIANAAHMTDPNPRPKRKLPAKLTEQQKEEIRQLMTDPAVMLKDVKARYGISTKFVYSIIGRKEGTPYRGIRRILKDPTQFAEVQRLLADGTIPIVEIAERYGIKATTLYRYAHAKRKRHPQPVKLTNQQKKEIRQLMADPAVMLKDVMARYGVHTKLVYDIIGRKEGTPFRRARKILKNPMQFAEVQRLLAEAIIPVKYIAQQYGVNLRTIRRYAPPKKIKKSNFSEQTIKTILQLINESDIPIKEIALRYDVNNSSIYKAIRIHAFSTQEIEEIWRLVYKRKMKINEIAEKYKFSVRLIHIIAPLVGHKYLRPYKLSEKDFAEIQQLSGEMTQQEIAQLFGVSSATISRFLSALKPKKMRRNPRVPVPSKETQKEIRKLLTEKVPLWKIVEKFHLHPKVLFALASETTPEGESSAPQAGEED